MDDAQMAPTEGQKLVGGPVYVDLGGTPLRLVIDNRALVALEAKWGSLGALNAELEKGADGRLVTAITDILTAGVRDLPSGVEVLDLMDPSQLGEYLEQIGAAFQRAGFETVNQGNAGGPTTGRSPGNGSTTRSSSASASRRRRSGR